MIIMIIILNCRKFAMPKTGINKEIRNTIITSSFLFFNFIYFYLLLSDSNFAGIGHMF